MKLKPGDLVIINSNSHFSGLGEFVEFNPLNFIYPYKVQVLNNTSYHGHVVSFRQKELKLFQNNLKEKETENNVQNSD